jgi:hypothetical protein
MGGHLPGEDEVPDERDDLGAGQPACPEEVGDETVLGAANTALASSMTAGMAAAKACPSPAETMAP